MSQAHSLATIEQPAAARLGGKAAGLARLAALGIPVPEGFVIGPEHFAEFADQNGLDALLAAQPLALDEPASFARAAEIMREAVEGAAIPAMTRAALRRIWAAAEPGAWIVRSSAIGEDADSDSFAGQLDSVLDVRTFAQLERGLRRCWASYYSARALFYQRARARPLRGMAVIVERMLDARLGGVMFTRAPTDPDAIAIEYVDGHPGGLVAGAIEPARMLVARGARPANAPFAELVEIGERLERAFGRAQDVEWIVDRDGKLWIVQSRAITTASERPRQLFSNVNVNENYPRPLSPLLYSIASEAYEHYFRNLGRLLGVREAALARVEGPLRHCVGAHGARLYYNLSNIHRAIAAAPFAAQLGAAFDGFVGIDEEGGARIAGALATGNYREAARVGLFALRAFSTISRRVARFEARVDDYAARTAALEGQGVEELFARFSEFIDIRRHRWADAALADLSATLAYAGLRALLRRTLGDAAARRLPQALLLAVPKVERVSAGPIAGIWALSRLARAQPSLREALGRLADESPEAVLAQLYADPRHGEFCQAFAKYLDKWGFRVSGELLLTTRSYVEDPAALLPVIAAYLDVDGPSPAESTAAQAVRRDRAIAEVRSALGWGWRLGFDRLLRATQTAIGYRERARMRQALLYCRFRMVVRELGRRLVARGRLERGDDLLFLSWRELDEWLTGHSMFPAAIPELIALRRREHARLATTQPPNVVRLAPGEYLDFAGERPDAGDPERLEGVGVAGGRVTGTARIIEDLAHAGEFRRGDCLVTRQTDPGWAPLFFLARGLVMERGGMLSHGAIVAREFGIPGVIAVRDATRILRSGEPIEVDGDRGLVRRLDREAPA